MAQLVANKLKVSYLMGEEYAYRAWSYVSRPYISFKIVVDFLHLPLL